MAQLYWYFDQTRCTGCFECSIACKDWNDIPPGPVSWRRSFELERGSFPRVEVMHISMSCLHCESAPCIAACPEQAIAKRDKDGVVLVDRNRCQGHQDCFEACPYGVPQFDPGPKPQKMSMCNYCVGRLDEGLRPACVDACNQRALDLGSKEELLQRYPGAVVPDAPGKVPGFPDPTRDHLGQPARHGPARPSILVKPRKPDPEVKGEWSIRKAGDLVERM